MTDLLQIIERKITDALSPIVIKIIDESKSHSNHYVDPNQVTAITHLQILIQSSSFDNKTPLQRHRIVYDLLADEIKLIHAISFSLRDSLNN